MDFIEYFEYARNRAMVAQIRWVFQRPVMGSKVFDKSGWKYYKMGR